MSFFRSCASILTLTVVVGGGLATPSAAASPTPRVVSIAQARSLPLGTTVTVYGTATTPSGWLESSSFDKGFGMQDLTAGIYVSIAADPDVDPRDVVRVTGVLRDSSGLLQLAAAGLADLRVLGRGLPVLPRLLPTGAVGEASEGQLVRVFGRVTQAPVSDLPYGYIFHINDGSGDLTIFVSTQPGIDLSGLTVGRRVAVTGFSGQFGDHYEVNPRFQHDVLLL